MRVLYVGDSSAEADLLEVELGRHDPAATVDRALTLAEARLRLTGKAPLDLVLVERTLPDGNGLDLLHEVRQSGLPVAFVLLTEAGDEGTAQAASEAGAHGAVTRDEGWRSRLPAVLEAALGRSRVETEPRREIGIAGLQRFRQIAEHEEALRQSEEKFSKAFASSPDAIVMTRVGDGQIVEVNESFVRLSGYSREEALGRTTLDLDMWVDRQDQAKYLAALRDHGGVREQEVKLRGKVEVRDALLSGGMFRLGEELVALTTIRDVTEARRAEQALQESERRFRESEGRYRSLFEGAPDGILVADAAGIYVDVNPSALIMLGYSRDELIGMSALDILAPSECPRVEPALAEINQGVEHRREWQFRRKDGSTFPADVMATVMPDGRILALIRDASERRRMEDQLRQSQKMEAVGTLAGGVAHDFNNVLGVIIGYAEMLRTQTPEGHPERRRIDQILRAAERGADLTRQLLAFSRKQVLEPRVLEPSAVVTDMRRLLEPLIGEHIDLVLKTAARGRVKVDPGQLEQVVMNLVVNARDAMPTGGSLSIETTDVDLDQEYVQRREVALQPGRYVAIAVADTGVGMDESTKARAFEPFFTTKPEGKGTGLGLAMVYGIVKQSEGFIWIYSEVGKGSVIRVYLPRVDEAVTKAKPRLPTFHRAGTERLLVVEDEPAARELVAEVLRAEGYEVLLAGDGQEAVELATRAKAPLHLLLTDVVLPKLSGRAAAEQIRIIHPGIKVLYMSGYTDDEVSRHGVLEPGIVLLQKPFTPDEVTRRVGEVLDQT
jgi:PAS domain S-box-containing protein